jgi:CBS domain containing-hemolysin-like protein
MTASHLLYVALFIVATAFFVATKFSILKLRPSRVDQLVLENHRNANTLKLVTINPDGYLSACQLGITITTLGLGWLGEPAVQYLLYPVFIFFELPGGVTSFVSFLISFGVITYLHVVLGELAPKSLAIHKTEAISLLTARPIIVFYKLMYPFIWLFNGSAILVIRLLGMKPVSEHEDAHSEEELRDILTESYESGKINRTEYGYVNRIFAFDDLLAREIMVPRIDMVCLYIDKTLEENVRVIKEEQYTRFPVVENNKDNIIGMVNTKHFFLQYHDRPQVEMSKLIHPILTVPDAIPVKALLKNMQQDRTHLAILVDEYGGTSGMVTIEDILEEIVGDIRDEFDAEEKLEVEKLGDDHYLIDGKVSISHVNDLLHAEIESDKIDTIGGWLYGQHTELKKGVEWHYNGIAFIIREKERHRIRKMEIMKLGKSTN